jgi:hypothetical protein
MRNLNPHTVGRAGLVIGLMASFSLVLMQVAGGRFIGFVVMAFLALAGYVVFIFVGNSGG